MRRMSMNMALAANQLIAETPGRVFHHPKKKHPALDFCQMLFAANIHDDAVHRIGPLTVRVMKTRSDRCESAMLRLWAEHSSAILKSPRLVAPANGKA